MVLENVIPAVDGGRYPVKRVLGESVEVEVDLFCDGHEALAGVVLYRGPYEKKWRQEALVFIENDRWRASFRVDAIGLWRYCVHGWVDRWGGFCRDLEKKVEAGAWLTWEWEEGARLLDEAARAARGKDRRRMEEAAEMMRDENLEIAVRLQPCRSAQITELMRCFSPRRGLAATEVLWVRVDRERARTGAWYEFFPRSCSPEPGRHATFQDAYQRLEEAAQMGFDVVYLPPIHPIGRTHRKGKNNQLQAETDDVGSPWAIGSKEGGHTSVHPELGTLKDFEAFVRKAKQLGLEVALDIAFQCSPDHPWVKEHPQWFRHRPDGSIHYAENPPKKYEDIYPLNFETPAWRELWQALFGVFDFWAERGIRIFRVDNPHTKAFRFWEWCIAEMKKKYPDSVFLSEAFTKPKVMQHLAKIGFCQSYTYFTWRNTKWEIEQYMRELTAPPLRDFFRPNFFANTPDILHAYLQTGGRPAFLIRLLLAATLGPSYGIYGPPFELAVTQAKPGTEEYQDSEKYQLRCWNTADPLSLKPWIQKINTIRKENPALHHLHGLEFCPVDNDALIAFLRWDAETRNLLLVVVNLDPHWTQSGWVTLPIERFGWPVGQSYLVVDLLDGATYTWREKVNFVKLNPGVSPAHVLKLPLDEVKK